MQITEVNTDALNLDHMYYKKVQSDTSKKSNKKYKKSVSNVPINVNIAVQYGPPFFKNGNFNAHKYILLFDQIVAVYNTCASDAMIEVCVSAYQIPEFRLVINKNYRDEIDNYLNFIKLYNQEGPTEWMYIMRGYILYRIYNRVTLDLNCNTNVTEFFEKAMAHTDFSTQRVETCQSGCFSNQITIDPVILGVCQNKYETCLQNLEIDTQNSLEQENLYCYTCQQLSVHRQFVIGAYLCLDVAGLFTPFRNEDQFKCSLKDIPIELNLQKFKIYSCWCSRT